MSDNEKSLSDEATFAGGMQPDEKDLQSLGDRSTLGGGDGSSISDLGSIGDVPDHDMEIVDLSKRYRIEKSLGKGGMGEVLLATDTRLDRQVAIKRIRADLAVGKTAAARFLQEAKAVASLSHPNIVSVHDYGRDADGPFLIIEYVSGGSLLSRCKEGPIELKEAIDLACQLCDGLGRAHDAGIIHRDIKPANILLTHDGVPKLTDFGLAKADSRDHTMTMAGAVLGTLDFMPPEQRQDASLTDSRSDLWSLAATLYQMVTGEPPRVIDLDDVPQELRKCISQALKSKKEDRFQTAIELRDALRGSLKSPEPITQAAIDLGAGECPSCHARNDASRKFCNGCGGSLRLTCLGCDAEIPVWEKFCGECGGNQQQLLDSRLEEIEKQKVEAEDLRGHHKYETALAIIEKILAIKDERLSLYRAWSEEFAESTKAEWKREKESATQHFTEAKKHREVFDYESAIHAIESIPESMRSSEIKNYLQLLESDRAESVSLVNEIRGCIERRDFDQLLPKVERGLKLLGDRADLTKLQQRLFERNAKRIKQRDDACNEAQKLFDGGDVKAALDLMNRLQVELTASQQALYERLSQFVSIEAELSAIAEELKAGGIVEPSKVLGLLSRTTESLQNHPNRDRSEELKQALTQLLTACTDDILAAFSSQVIENLISVISLPPSVISRIPSIKNTIGMELKLIPSGVFGMGRNSWFGPERPVHQVTLTKPFFLGVYQVTQEQYERVMGSNPSQFIGPQNPVEEVSWEDAMGFCRKLSVLPEERAAGRVYRLPTEAEWEYACRAGTTTEYGFGDDASDLGHYAWYSSNSKGRTHPVGKKKPNAWGLYDMHGNVGEWCADWYGTYPSSSVTDPRGPRSGSLRVFRGGCWSDAAEFCRSADRYRNYPSYRYDYSGFRVTCVPSGQ